MLFDKGFNNTKPQSLDEAKCKIDLWTDVKDFIFSRCKHINIIQNGAKSESDLNEEYPFIFKLYNEYLQNSRNNINITNESLYKFDDMLLSLNSYFLVDKALLGFSPSEKGLTKFDSKKILSHWLYKTSYKFSCRKNAGENQFNYKVLESFKHYANEIILLDRYILSDFYKFTHNIKRLAASLFHNKNLTFYIITSSSDIDKKINNIKKEIDDFCAANKKMKIYLFLDKRTKLIEDKKNGTKKDIFSREHSRYLITNYILFKSGQGFHFENREGKLNNTYSDEVDISPLIHNENIDILMNILTSVREIIRSDDNNQIDFLPLKRTNIFKAFFPS